MLNIGIKGLIMTYQVDRLQLTAAGLQAIQNADAGGILVNPVFFALGDFAGETTEVQDALQGGTVHSGKISYVEVLNANTVRFTMDIPHDVGDYAGKPIYEVLISSDNGTALAYGTLSKPHVKFKDRGLRLDILLHSSVTELTTLNVTLSEFGSIPSVPSVNNLPNPVLAQNNAVSVLDLITTSDGKTAPGLACRHGDGGSKWGFYGHDRIFEGILGAGNAVSPDELEKAEVIGEYDLQDDAIIVIQIISGTGAGEVRKFRVSGTSLLAETSGFTDIDDNSVIAMWQIIVSGSGGNSGSCPWPPEGDNIPEDWILKRGTTCPYWSPAGSKSPSNTRLYKRPTRLVMSNVSVATDSSKLSYPLGDLYPENGNYVSMSMSGIENHKQGFEVLDNIIEIAETLPNQIMLDLRIFTREPSSGTKLVVKSKHYVGDGTTVEFELTSEPKNAIYVWAYVSHIKQGLVSYVIEGKMLKFTEAPPAGLSIELNVFSHEEVEGYSTDISSVQYKTTDLTNILELPFEPQDKELVFISEQGYHVDKTKYSIVGNKVLFSGAIDKHRSMEVIIFNNIQSQGKATDDLPGVVVDAISTSKGILLVRHNAPPIRIPAPEFSIVGSAGIKVTGEYPYFKVESELAQLLAQDKFRNYNRQQVVEAGETITVSQRIKFKGDILNMAAADFSAELGPGFSASSGFERIQTVIGFKTTGQNEPDFGRGINGSDERGFSSSNKSGTDTVAYSGLSTSQSFDILKENHSAGYIDIIAKMRVVDANISTYGSNLKIGLNIIVIPKLG